MLSWADQIRSEDTGVYVTTWSSVGRARRRVWDGPGPQLPAHGSPLENNNKQKG